MTSKHKKSITSWIKCTKCEAIFTQKDLETHKQECPVSNDEWNHNFIKNKILYSTIELYKPAELPKNISDHESAHMVFLSQSAMQICELPIGDPAVLIFKDNVVVKSAWPTSEKSLTTVSLMKNAMDLDKLEGSVKLQKLKSNVHLAREVLIKYVGKYELPPLTTELQVMIKHYNEEKIFSTGNRISIPHYGRKLLFKIIGATTSVSKDDTSHELCSEFKKIDFSDDILQEKQFYKAIYSTKWTIINQHEEQKIPKSKVRYKLNDIGGYEDLIKDIQDVLDIALGKYGTFTDFAVSKGILLYGPNGVGKSMIAEALLYESNVHMVTITVSDLYNKSSRDIESTLISQLEEAIAAAPSIIYIEDIDVLLPKKLSSEHEKRILSAILMLLDSLQNVNVAVLATTSKLEAISSSLRRPGRLDKEFEVCVPTPAARKNIIYKLLTKIKHNLTPEEIDHIAFVTHGYVGADLYGLFSQAFIHAIKRQRDVSAQLDCFNNAIVRIEDIRYALTVVNPTAMKEVLVEIPNVRWSDIGGQDDLKLKLKQAVEWPLKHPEVFVNLGIVPPRGVLMFGPPGCSKTMVAKALATESKLNFLNIKGPELFSKWVGESEKAVREVFRKAKQVAPSIIFIDEIDALGGERGSSNSNGSNVQERVLAQLLTELDGVTSLGNVTLVAATNRPDRIDKALLRPGRLDRIIYVQLPDAKTREEIFGIKFRKMPVAKDVNIHDLVDLTEGYSGAEIQAICHEAAMKALEENLEAQTITKEHFKAALSIVTPRTPPSLIRLYEEYIKNI